MTKASQSGIAIGPILFIVAILAVLASAVAAGSGAFNSDTSAVKAKAQASAILEYANEVKMAVDRVRGHGCSDEQVSFENPLHGTYTNPNAPGDKSCHVFDPNGGGISFLPIKVSTLETGNDGYFEFQGTHRIKELGSGSAAELMGFLPLDSLTLCQKINEMVGMAGYLGQDHYQIVRTYDFVGSYSATNIMVDDGGTWKNGQMMGCVQKAAITPTYPPFYAPYFFYTVLIVR